MIYDPLRKLHVKATPEELVRQKWLDKMIELGYPPQHIAVEKSLRELLSHTFSKEKLPSRRVDIVCFSSKGLTPLLMIECKAIPLTEDALQQVLGYNHFLKATFVAIANASQIITGWYDCEKRDYSFIEELPSYEALMRASS